MPSCASDGKIVLGTIIGYNQFTTRAMSHVAVRWYARGDVEFLWASPKFRNSTFLIVTLIVGLATRNIAKERCGAYEMIIRQETKNDHKEVFNVIESAFKDAEFADHTEQFLVERLRKSDAFIPELSMVAEIDGKIVGHILLTKIKIKNETTEFDSLALAPVSVLPGFQGKGIGGKLILESHKKAEELRYKSIVLLGHNRYYPRFGYEQADKYGIELPFEVPKENCMVIELIADGLKGVNGMVEYPKEFNE